MMLFLAGFGPQWALIDMRQLTYPGVTYARLGMRQLTYARVAYFRLDILSNDLKPSINVWMVALHFFVKTERW